MPQQQRRRPPPRPGVQNRVWPINNNNSYNYWQPCNYRYRLDGVIFGTWPFYRVIVSMIKSSCYTHREDACPLIGYDPRMVAMRLRQMPIPLSRVWLVTGHKDVPRGCGVPLSHPMPCTFTSYRVVIRRMTLGITSIIMTTTTTTPTTSRLPFNVSTVLSRYTPQVGLYNTWPSMDGPIPPMPHPRQLLAPMARTTKRRAPKSWPIQPSLSPLLWMEPRGRGGMCRVPFPIRIRQ